MTIAAQCHACVDIFKSIASYDTNLKTLADDKLQAAANDELDRFSLWVGNIGALHPPGSPLSLEKRLEDGQDLLKYASSLLEDLEEVVSELLNLVSEGCNGAVEREESHRQEEISTTDPSELMQEIGQCITRLYKMTNLIRGAAPTDPFAKALSRNRYFFNEQYDIAHVGEKFPNLATPEMSWLRERLGRAITQRRRYLSYIQNHRDQLERMMRPEEQGIEAGTVEALPMADLPVIKSAHLDTASRPSTLFTKATTVVVEQITPTMLAVDDDSDPEDDAKSYTTVSRSEPGDLDTSAAIKVPKLEDLRTGTKKEVECKFCFRVKRFRNERTWRKHVFSDLRTYVCTFADCNSPYFGDINDWFRHEMSNHRVSYSCQLCPQRYYETGELYLSHVHQKHPTLLLAGDEQTVLSIARTPVDHLNPQDCPCCNDWPDRLRSRAAAEAADLGLSNDPVYVAPNLFKRHLASHLEILALFAVPIPHSSAEEETKSMVANGEVETDVLNVPSQSPITFTSRSRSSSTEQLPSIDAEDTEPDDFKVLGEVLQDLLAHVDFGELSNQATLIASNLTSVGADAARRLRLRASALILADDNHDLQILVDVLKKLKAAPEDVLYRGARLLFASLPKDQLDNFRRQAARALLNAYQDLLTEGLLPIPRVRLAEQSSPDSPASSHDIVGSPTDVIRPVESVPSLLPPPNATNSSVEELSLDSIPYPSFLRPRKSALLDQKWEDLRQAQVNRWRDNINPTDDGEPTQWARCDGKPYAPRNRYINIGPYQANRVRLRVPDGVDDYINASPIELRTTRTKSRLRYIATQGPEANSWSHFWRMVWYETASPAVIVMVTKTHEQGREKCYPYYPKSTSEPVLRVNEHDEFGDGLVSNLHLVDLSHLEDARTEVRELDMIREVDMAREADIAKVKIARKDGTVEGDAAFAPRKIWHLLFEAWPNFLVPKGSDKFALLGLVKFAREKNTSESPIIIQGSAGMGRTGTFIALDWLMHELQEGALDEVPEEEDPIVRCIQWMRDQRPMMVQTKQQFVFLYDVLREQWRKRWIALHPEEARVLGMSHGGPVSEEEGRTQERFKGSTRSEDLDASVVSDVERAKPEAELMGADYE